MSKNTERKLTKSEQLLLKIGQEVECDICHHQVLMSNRWKLTAERDSNNNFINKRSVCPTCQPEMSLLVSI